MSRWISAGVHLDGDEPECRCDSECEMPCWQMAGLTPEGEDRCRGCGCDQPPAATPEGTDGDA